MPVKKPSAVVDALLWRYPAVRRTLRERPARYNACLDLIERLEQEGSVFVIRPVKQLVVGRMDRDPARLEALYRQGYDEADGHIAELVKWMEASRGT
jgi:predicted patatin/cPLA2 family phospholipase